MPARIKVYPPPVTDSPSTQITTNYTTGTTLVVQNTTDFEINDYLLIERIGSAQAELGQISSITNATTLVLVGALKFPHNIDTQVTRIDYNQFKVYRSTTGVGGTYILLDTEPFDWDQSFTWYIDQSGIAAYSYKTTMWNSTTSVESLASGENPAGGFPFYALGRVQSRVLQLYVDETGEFIAESSIADWCNELTTKLNRAVTGTESALFVNSVNFIPGNNEYTDLTTYNVEGIALIEYSTDGGVTFNNDTINPMDMRIKATNPTSLYSYKLIDQKLFIYNSTATTAAVPDFPAAYTVRMWFYTQQPLMSFKSDYIPTVYRSFSDVYVDYCMMRANEQSRRFQESAAYYYNKLFKGDSKNDPTIKIIIDSVSSRIGQGNKSMATTWLDSFSNW